MLLLLCRINSIDTWLILCHLHAHAGAVEGSGHAAASNVQPRSLDAFFVMRTLEPMRKRLEAAKKAEFATAQATRLTQQQLLEKEAELGLKRRRVEPDEEDKQWERWGYSDWTRQESWTQERRAVSLNPRVNVAMPRDGEFGYLHHWRRGLIGGVQDWARGSVAVAVRSVNGQLRSTARCKIRASYFNFL